MPTPGQELSSLNFGSMIGGPLCAVIDAQSQSSMTTVNFIKTTGFEPDTTDEDGNLVPGKPIVVSFRYGKEVTPYQPGGPPTIAISVAPGGSSYTTVPNVQISGGSGSGATAVAQLSGGTVTGITVTNQGTGYKAGDTPTVTIDPPPAATGSAQAKATAAVTSADAKPAVTQQMQLDVPILMMLPVPFIRIEDVTVDFNAKIHSTEYAETDTNLGIGGNLRVRQGWGTGSARLQVSASYQKKTTQGTSVERDFSLAVHVHAVQDEMPAGMERIFGILDGAMTSTPAGQPQAGTLLTK